MREGRLREPAPGGDVVDHDPPIQDRGDPGAVRREGPGLQPPGILDVAPERSGAWTAEIEQAQLSRAQHLEPLLTFDKLRPDHPAAVRRKSGAPPESQETVETAALPVYQESRSEMASRIDPVDHDPGA